MAYDEKRTLELLQEPYRDQFMDELIALNGGLVNLQLRKLGLLRNEDAQSIGTIALYKALKAYKVSSGTKISTYASVCIYNTLGNYLRRTNSLMNRATMLAYEDLVVEVTQEVDSDIIAKELLDTVEKLYNAVKNPKHRLILRKWIDSSFTMTGTALAKEVGVSQTYASLIIGEYKAKLKGWLK